MRLLSARNGAGDRDEAIKMLSDQLSHLETLERHARSEVVASLIDLYCRTNRALEAARTLDELPREVLAPEVFHIIQALRLRWTEDIEGAKREAKEAALHLGPESDRRERRRVAAELTTLGLVENALPIWKQLVEPRYLGLDTERLLYCAVKCDDAKFIAEFCAELRQNGIIHREAFHQEINTLQEYHCFNRAMDAMRGYLQSAPETAFTKEIRARLSNLALITGRDELVECRPREIAVGLRCGVRSWPRSSPTVEPGPRADQWRAVRVRTPKKAIRFSLGAHGYGHVNSFWPPGQTRTGGASLPAREQQCATRRTIPAGSVGTLSRMVPIPIRRVMSTRRTMAFHAH